MVNNVKEKLKIDSKPLIILTGPTAVGKTDLSIKLAKVLDGEIVSADSAQVYKGLDIGSAKVTEEEMQGVPHHLIDVYEPDFSFDVTVFKEEAKKAVEEIYSRGRIPIIVGGTGFYIQALLYDISFDESEETGEYLADFEEEIRKQGASGETFREVLENYVALFNTKSDNTNNLSDIKNLNDTNNLNNIHDTNENKALDVLYSKLTEIDSDSTKVIHKNNYRKVIRALEFYHFYGEPISAHNSREREKSSAYNSIYFVLNMNRDRLYERINKRVDIMINNGLVEEVKQLKEQGLTRDMTSMQAIGYKEIYDALETGGSMEEAAEQIKLNTRHFAKRQLTWFRREKDVIWLDRDEFSNNYTLDSAETDDRILEYIFNKISQ
ncbi:MAG: tRNA (adenosine(37)-N6)-dimethylallyltransferase MiaA [Eubacterium sp.]|nr:tRNA (adenosine(37)-N6)-dimethylallyltransferase MiaA [Eubacterium sp.]